MRRAWGREKRENGQDVVRRSKRKRPKENSRDFAELTRIAVREGRTSVMPELECGQCGNLVGSMAEENK